MITIGATEADLAALLEKVAQGEFVTITKQVNASRFHVVENSKNILQNISSKS
ncbi:MAG: type II toxin-antitoxin system Phd/YefM family antitoxin [Thermoguttaceae bacterium]